MQEDFQQLEGLFQVSCDVSGEDLEDLEDNFLLENDDCEDTDESLDLDEDLEEFVSDNLPEDSHLSTYFESAQVRLSKESYPSKYARGTFWIEPMMSYFILKKNKKVESLYQPRIFLWIPHLLTEEGLKGLHCPSCDSRIETKEFNRQPHARRIVNLDS
ncbi:hypothetical protein BD560DRAFT_441080 [Blakeslea trispora]|nr:hypothetical protein BD560DRAFT_441080 [Blakeslea trispora]